MAKLIVAFYFLVVVALVVSVEDGKIISNDFAKDVVSRVKRADKPCNTLLPFCVNPMCNECCNGECKGDDCVQLMCSVCCA
ncbi:hypothetical protein M3Y98_00075100 [Aphelenchoides besseyi]|nr:hypothetical protein M3Y98_00075100 [Aphelenchoides besseyi]